MTRNLQKISVAKPGSSIIYTKKSSERLISTYFVLGGISKRSIDVILSAMALVFLSPILALIAIVVKLCDGGPVLFTHQRIGFAGQPFGCLKFRTMCVDAEARLAEHLVANPQAAAEWYATQKLKADPRLTAIGGALRRSSIDELPQLVNVLRGEMSLVGPRPIVDDEIARYGRDALYYLATRPGLTGAWQVSGRNDVSYAERVQLDAEYYRTWSLAKDILIMFRTIPTLFSRRGSY